MFRSLTRPNLISLRQENPRRVIEYPEAYVLRGTNFELLMKLFQMISTDLREGFLIYLMKVIASGGATSPAGGRDRFPSLANRVSNLPLIAELFIRTGNLRRLMEALGKLNEPTIATAMMLMQIEELISINFHLLSKSELNFVKASLDPLRQKAALIVEKRLSSTIRGRTAPVYQAAREFVYTIGSIIAECEQAKYIYLKQSLQQQKPNLEIETDRVAVVGYLDSLGFDPILKQSLEAAEQEYRGANTPFDLKNCLGLIRTFYEHLHIQGGAALAASGGKTIVAQWDPTITYLKNSSFLTMQQEKFARGLHTLLSDEGVHALIPQQEFARLLRNMVIEYGLMFLTMLGKKGVKIS
jgi:hypothetical protein